MKSKQAYKGLFGILFALLLLVSAVMSGRVTLPAFAAETGYTGALEDLQKDENFNVSDYPDKANDYSINVIQIAESTGGELFIYTYQPCQKTRYLVATEINMSLSESVDGTRLYGLTLLSGDGVLCKYKVNDITINSAIETRYYNITSIYREWIKGVDGDIDNDNVKNAVVFPVGILWRAVTENGEVYYGYNETETVEITDKYVSFLRYYTGMHIFGRTECDSHYVAFSTDKRIDKLIDAEVYYTSRSVECKHYPISSIDDKYVYGERIQKTVTLSDIDTVSVGGGLFAKTYEWNRIQTVKNFSESVKLTEADKAGISGKSWVLRFAETDYDFYTSTSNASIDRENYTEVSEVSILRLKFETDGIVYNLGTIDGKQSGSAIPGNLPDTAIANFFEKVWNAIKRFFTGKSPWWVYLIVVLVVLAPVLGILAAFIPPFGRFLLNALKWAGKGLWWLVSAPFRGIIALVQKIKEKKGGS